MNPPVAPDTSLAAPSQQESPELFPIVGVGASAGGLAATAQLLRHLGPQPRLAVVIVHHLDPSHDSSLVDIFSRVTTLPVYAASQGLQVAPNHVYVVPPNAELGISDGKLCLTPRREAGGLHLPIDRFFESLAADRTVQALGVVLTGTGADGTLGCKAIKAEGGITFAQDASAEYRSMPESAIATGCVDFILPLLGIARELVRIGEHGPLLAAAADDAPEFAHILSALRKASGIDFVNYKPSTLRRRVQRRVVISGLANLREYAELIDKSPQETRILCDEVLIHVTSFFRDPEMFDALKTTVFPLLLKSRPRNDCIRIWVAGCSTGEEVYSIAISLLEFLADEKAGDIPVKLFGTDVSANAIDRSRSGKYPTSIERDVSPERLKRFFSGVGGYQIRKDVRDLCVFAKQDATRDPPFAGMDLISCRNLMIYLGSALQDKILPLFHYALKEPGFLVLGTAETVRSFPGFLPLDSKNRIYTRTSAAPRLVFDYTARRQAAPVREVSAGSQPSGPLEVHREADRLVLAEFAPPGVVITDDLAIVQFRGRTGPFLEPAPGVASFDLLHMVQQELRLPLRQTIDDARARQTTVRRTGLTIVSGPAPRSIEIEVIPFRVAATPQPFFVVLFRELSLAAAPLAAIPLPNIAPSSAESQLAQELASTRDYLQSVIDQLETSNEELKAANEEIFASNEELRSTNEELQMAKEELQATNEELGTVNDEMTVRNVEATRLNDDLTNVLQSVEIPIVILGRDSRVRRFTSAAAKVFTLITTDIGRPIIDTQSLIPAPELKAMITQVLERLSAVVRTVQDEAGHFYQLTVRPYVTLDNRIDGTVLTAFDIDAVKKGAQLLGEAQKYAESIIDTISECLVVLDGELRVRSANHAFYQMFALTAVDIESRNLDEIGRGDWNIPALKKRLLELGEDDKIAGLVIAREFQHAGRRVFVLNARRIEKTSSILLALADITAKEHAEQALKKTETGFREMLTTLAEAILMTDGSGQIIFANQMAAQMFGYSMDELMGLPVDVLIPERLRDHHARHRAEFMAAPSTRRMGRDRDLVGRRKDGSEFPIEVILGSMHQDSGPLVMSFITDITRRRESDKKLRDYQDKLQRMAFDAALAEERERRQIAADLHDRIGQSLALAQIKLTSLHEPLTATSRAAVDTAVELLAQSIGDTRTLIFELSPPVLYDLGIKEALSWLVEEVEKRHGLQIQLIDDGMEKLLDDGAAALVFRAVRELLLNVFKHAKTLSASVSLRRTGDQFDIDVQDQGVGFDPSELNFRSTSGGFGLFSLREQISRLGGTVAVSSAPSQGTRISIRVPLKVVPPPPTAATKETP